MVMRIAAAVALCFATQSAAASADPPPWFAVLGARVGDLNVRMPVVDRVVLVPDEATFLDELSRWTLRGRWPILFEDDWFAPRFIRAFKPRSVERRASINAVADRESLQGSVDRAVARAWDGAEGVTAREAIAATQFTPPGLVITSKDDPAWCAAAALAAWHGQPIHWLEGDQGGLNGALPAESFILLSNAVEQAARDCGYPALELGDAIETVTLCRLTGVKATLPSTPQFRQVGNYTGSDPAAITDALCRKQDGSRWAIAASIFGSRERTLTAAMSSIFLGRTEVLLWNSYPSVPPWGDYGMSDVKSTFERGGSHVRSNAGSAAELPSWNNASAHGLDADVLFLNSKGNWDFFDLADDTRADAYDVPPIARPLALHMIHSWSLQFPGMTQSIGDRWLEHGVYSYVGSVQEPMLSAFVPPSLISDRVMHLVPFLVASRWLAGPMDAVWRVMLWGDPLMQIVPTAQLPVQPRIDPATVAATTRDGCVSVREGAIALLQRAKSGAVPPTAMGDVVRDIALLGDTALASNCFIVAETLSQDAARASARFALEPLLLQRNVEGFMRAFALLDNPTMHQKDLLWAMWTPFLRGVLEKSTVQILAENPRYPRAQVDLGRLLDAMKRALGAEATRAAILRALGHCDEEGDRRALTQLLGAI